MKFTRSFLSKLEDLCERLGYKIRYEQGHFHAGYCRVESKKLIIINKFFELEARINCFLELLPDLPFDMSTTDEDTISIYQKILDLRPQEAEEVAS